MPHPLTETQKPSHAECDWCALPGAYDEKLDACLCPDCLEILAAEHDADAALDHEREG